MSKEIRAHLFRTIAEGATAASLEKAVIAFAKSPPAAVSFSHEGVDYLAKEFAWSQNHSLFAGTIYRLKERGLPVKVHGQQTQPIPLATGESLGEPASFAWMPKSHAVLLHYAHNGPRHTALKPLLSKMGFAGPVIIEPVIRTDMLVKLRGATRFSHVEFTLHDPAGAPKLRAVGGAVGGAAKINEVLGSINIKVVATMGHSQGDGLLKDAVRRLRSV